jgi:hypothetical protein
MDDTMPGLIERIEYLEAAVDLLLTVLKQCEPTSHVLARLTE